MNDIRYVSLSDLHLGAENSILTRLTSVSNGAVNWKADPTKASDVMIRGRGRVRVRLGNEKERGGSRTIVESVFFEPGNCPSVSNRAEEVAIARPKRGSNLAIVPNRTRTRPRPRSPLLPGRARF